MSRNYSEVITLPASRFEYFKGDIGKSYSCSSATGDRIKKPFKLEGRGLFVCMGTGWHNDYRDKQTHEAYRVVKPEDFEGETERYTSRRGGWSLTGQTGEDDWERARNDPRGFYHGLLVWQGKKQYVLEGPPILLVEGPELGIQQELF